MASAAGALPERVGRVGAWWNPVHEVDVVGLDDWGGAAICGARTWQAQPFDWNELERYLAHVQAMGPLVRPDATHLLFSKSATHLLFSKTGFTGRVRTWAESRPARLIGPETLLAPCS